MANYETTVAVAQLSFPSFWPLFCQLFELPIYFSKRQRVPCAIFRSPD